MNDGSIEIRIVTDDGAVDWTVKDPESVSFQDTLGTITQVLPSSAIQAFEYEDEDGDRITVRSDEELTNMLSFYLGIFRDAFSNGGMVEPLCIYPRVSKPPGKRNIHGLKVQTKEDGLPGSTGTSPMDQDSGSKKQESRDIREILAGGSITQSDIHPLEILGSGNAGTVYRAHHLPSATIMAVKAIPVDITPEAQRQILSELEILYRCHSPVIIAFYGAYFAENKISICTEYMDGGSLDKYGQISEAILGRIAWSVLHGLHYLWGLKIMHRDVKPSNILVNTKGQVKLCDFGVSVQLVNSIAKTFVGTNAYMAPERIKGEDYSIHSEVWSLGVSLFELAAGRFPYDSANNSASRPMDLVNSIIEKVPPQLPKGVFTDAFIDFVCHCMTKDPRTRPSPAMLLTHPFIRKYEDGDTSIMALWVTTELEKINLQEYSHKDKSA